MFTISGAHNFFLVYEIPSLKTPVLQREDQGNNNFPSPL